MKKVITSTQELVQILKKRRKELKISQADLGKLCDLSLNGISKFESSNGEREVKLSTLFKISHFLGFKLNLEIEE